MRSTSTRVVYGLIVAAITLGPARTIHGMQTPQPQHQAHRPASQQQEKPGTHGKMTMDCESMMAAHKKMMEGMNAMDARLDTLVQTMNSATGPAKMDATAAVVTELVSQRKAMRERMSGMQAAMMQHMMEHAQAGTTDCPMMKEMAGSMKH
jgi:hypothetical protein